MISGGQKGYDRLLVLARERSQDTAELFDRIGVGPGLRWLDAADPRTLIATPWVFELWARKP